MRNQINFFHVITVIFFFHSFSHRRKIGTGVMGTGAVTAYRAVPRPRTKFNAVRFSTSHATGQVTTVRSDVPEALTAVALQDTVALLNVRRLDDIGTGDYHAWRRNLIGSTVSAATASPPAFGHGAESRGAEKVQALSQHELVVASIEDLVM